MNPQHESSDENIEKKDAGSDPANSAGYSADDRQSKQAPTSAVSASSRKHRMRPLTWEWNLPLLGATVAALVVIPPILYFAYTFQTSRVVDGIWSRADTAKAEGDLRTESKWLNLLVTFNKDDKEALVRLAEAINGSAQSRSDTFEAQRALVNALGALGESDNPETIRKLRCMLIQRLLDLGNGWAGEAERQVLLLKAEIEDPDALKWLALSLNTQVDSGEWRTRNKVRYERQSDFWAWASFQPVGDLLRLALDKNPGSTELSIALLNAHVTRKNYFDETDNDESRMRHSDSAKALIEQLKDKNDAKAQWSSYVFAMKLDQELARRLLPSMASMAMERLNAKPRSNSAESTSNANALKKQERESADGDLDAQLVASHATLLNEQGESDKALRRFQELIAAESGLVPNYLLESVYVGAGESLRNLGKASDANRLWREGCERVGPLDGLALWHTIAFHACESGSVDEGKSAIDELNVAIKKATASLLDLSVVRAEARQAKQNRVDAVKWYSEVLNAGLDLRNGKSNVAVQSLTNALTTKVPIPLPHRSYALKLLAKAQSDLGVWDLSARALEEAIAIDPNDKILRRQAAEAWGRAGGGQRMIDQLKLSDDGSFDIALTMMQSVISSQQALVPSQRDHTKIRRAIDEAEARLAKEKLKGGTLTREWLFEAIKLSYESGMGESKALVSSEEREAKFFELVKRFRTVPELQSMSAIAFRSSGKVHESNVALQNLDESKESNFSLWLATHVRLALIDKDQAAAKKLIEEAIESGRMPKSEILNLAASWFESSGNLSEAYHYVKLNSVAKSESELFRLGTLLLDLEQQSKNQNPSENTTALPNGNLSGELDDVIRQLTEFEGASGSRWRLLKANRLYKNYLTTKKESELRDAAKLHAEIMTMRPKWATALTLGGEIASAQNDAEKAVGFYQRAISEGDNRPSTVYGLVRELNSLGRFSEAEIEFERIAEHTGRVEQVSELAIGFAQRKGQHDEALKLARQGTERRPNDPTAWLLRAQAAVMNIPKLPDLKADLTAEVEQALDEANRLSDTSDVNVWLYKFRFAMQFQGLDAVQRIAESLEASKIPEKRKKLLSIQAKLYSKEFDAAKKMLDAAIAEAPRDIELKVSLVEYFRMTGDQQSQNEILEELVRIDPKRDDFRRALAIGLATVAQTSGPPPWDRIAALVGDTSGGETTEASKLFHALLLATRGDANQLKKSKQLLKDLAKSRSPDVSDEAIRLLIAIEQNRWKLSTEQVDTAVEADSFAEIRRLFDLLTKKKNPAAVDLLRYADFLLNASKTSDVPWLVDRVQAITPDSPFILNMRVRQAKIEKRPESIPSIVDSWIQADSNNKAYSRVAVAGSTLMQLGFEDLGVNYLKRAYEEDEKEFRPYVMILSRTGKSKEAIDICISQSKSKLAPEAIAMLADVAFTDAGLNKLDERVEKVFAVALDSFPTNATILESLGTLRLNQQRYTEAYDLLKRAEAVAPNNLMTLNNIAMTTAEIPGKEKEGLLRIKRAIELYGRHPELLDTLGLVQLKCGMLKEAESSLQEAVNRGSDPRFRLHLIQVLGARNNSAEIQKIGRQLNIKELRKMPLTASERLVVEEVSKNFGNESS